MKLRSEGTKKNMHKTLLPSTADNRMAHGTAQLAMMMTCPMQLGDAFT